MSVDAEIEQHFVIVHFLTQENIATILIVSFVIVYPVSNYKALQGIFTEAISPELAS